MLNFLMGRQSSAPGLSVKDAVERSAKGEVILVDVRDISELKMTGKAKGAIHVPLALLQMQANPSSPEFNKALDTSKTVAVYCASGARSSMAARTLQQSGFEDVHNIGGFGHWQMAGGPVERV